ncbi:MAG: TonB-dependent receptor [Rhizomicrobium sp.]
MAGAAILTLLGLSAPAAAADTETVVVTGSRIPQSNLTNPSPLSVKDADAIQLTSAYSLEDVLKTMTGADSLGLSNNSNNGGNGLSEISLRGLGPARTLVLIDGQRLIPVFAGSISVPDINSVPISMIDRVEVLRDGASSVYGADAVGGVVNIITKRDFSGLQFDGEAGGSEHGGGDTYSIGATLGINMDRGNVTISVLNQNEGAIGQWQRDWASDPHATDPNFPGGSIARSQPATLKDETGSEIWVHGVAGTTHDPALAAQVPCSFFIGGTLKLNAGCDTAEGGWNTLQGSLGRTQLALNGHYDITPDVTFIVQGSFNDRRSGQQLRPEPLLGDSIATTDPATGNIIYPGFYVPADPHWGYPGGGNVQPGGTQACPDPTGCILAFDTPVQFGPRTYRQTSETYRIRVGLEGNLFSDYHWEAGYVQQRNEDTNRVYNTGNFYHLAQAMGQIPCVDVPGGCVFNPAIGFAVPVAPPNFYDEPNGLTPAQLAYLKYTQVDTNRSIENYAYADIHGPVIDLPYGTMQGALGVERRFESLSDTPDALVQASYAPNQTFPTSGGYGVYSAYGELQIPVLAGLPFARALDVTPSVRYDHYSTFGNATTYKVGANWTVIDDLRFRGTYSTGFRAPNVSELFGGHAVSDNTLDGDPCDVRGVVNGNSNMGQASLAPGSTCYAALTAQGLTPAQIATHQSPENDLASDQRGIIIGGNPALLPEKSHGWNVGTVITPSFVPGFSFGGDYYETTVTNAIQGGGGIPAAVGLDSFVLQCYGPLQSAAACSKITRNANGIFQISALNANFGANKVTGMELQLNYDTDAADIELPVPGSFVFNAEMTREFSNVQILPTGDIHNTGHFNAGVELNYPAYRSTLNLDWKLMAWTFHWDTEFASHTTNLDGSAPIFGNVLSDNWNNNVSVAYDLNDWVGDQTFLKSSRIIFGVNNLFDQDAPFLGGDSICKCNSFAGGGYDFVGRFFYMRLTAKM